mmetsp:Transcript_0/g.1  ORF Transcript_0/g.1 Transcript_0/m.1 type:complete len:380 (+) Transcript_0:264-1403(+)
MLDRVAAAVQDAGPGAVAEAEVAVERFIAAAGAADLGDAGRASLDHGAAALVSKRFLSDAQLRVLSLGHDTVDMGALAVKMEEAGGSPNGYLDVVWDLDDCLIKSEKMGDELADPAMSTTVLYRRDGRAGTVIEHVDDDLIPFRTRLRPWARLTIAALAPFCRQHVFTSATRGYMINVVSLVEGRDGRDSSGEAAFPFLGPARLSISDFPDGHLRKNGKPVDALPISTGPHRQVVLIDDGHRYHKAQPLEGVLIQKFPPPGDSDPELLNVLQVLLLSVIAAAVDRAGAVPPSRTLSLAKTLAEYQAKSDEYWNGVVKAVSRDVLKGLDKKKPNRDLWARGMAEYASKHRITPVAPDSPPWAVERWHCWEKAVQKAAPAE